MFVYLFGRQALICSKPIKAGLSLRLTRSLFAVAHLISRYPRARSNRRRDTPPYSGMASIIKSLSLWLTTAAVETLLVGLYFWWRARGAGRRRLPGPRGIPLIGCLRLLF